MYQKYLLQQLHSEEPFSWISLSGVQVDEGNEMFSVTVPGFNEIIYHI